jgi:hypothetical protein
VVYDFAINERGTQSALLDAESCLMPPEYYSLLVWGLLRIDPSLLSATRRRELASFNESLPDRATFPFDGPESLRFHTAAFDGYELRRWAQHQQIQAGLKSGCLGLAQNRQPSSTSIEDVLPEDVFDATHRFPAGIAMLE